MKNVLVFAPHPDDEVLGCGGTIAFLIKKKYRVNLCLVTESYKPDWTEAFIKNRVEEIRKANRALGIKKVFSLCLPAVKLDTVSQKELNDKLLAIVKKVKPEIILMPHCGDLNIDHRLVAEAALVASRPSKNKSRAVLAYETLSETEWGLRNIPFTPNVYCDISSTLNQKIRAMRCYASEIRKFPHPRSLAVIKALAEKRGSESGVKYSEAFMAIRMML